MGRGRTHASSSAFSALVRVSFDLSVGRHGRIFVFVSSVVPPKSSSRRCVDFFVAPFFGPLVTPPSRGPRCLLRAPGRRLWRDDESMSANVHKRARPNVTVVVWGEGEGGGGGVRERLTCPTPLCLR